MELKNREIVKKLVCEQAAHTHTFRMLALTSSFKRAWLRGLVLQDLSIHSGIGRRSC